MGNAWTKEFTLDCITANFGEFIALVKAETGVSIGNKKKEYPDDWQEKNLDGSFAYNGVTDDF